MIVEEDVNSSHLLQRLVYDLLALVSALEVRSVGVALLSVLLNMRLCLLCIFLLFRQVGDEHVRTLHGEQDGCCLTYSRVATSNQCFLALELAGGLVELVFAIFGGHLVDGGLWVEFALEARYRLAAGGDLVACVELLA